MRVSFSASSWNYDVPNPDEEIEWPLPNKKKRVEGGESDKVALDIPATLAEDILHVPHQATEASARENPNSLPVDEHSQMGFSVYRINYVHVRGNMLIFHVLLNILKGPTCYDDIKSFEGVLVLGYKKHVLLGVDQEYIDDIVRRSYESSTSVLWQEFVMMLMNDSLSMP